MISRIKISDDTKGEYDSVTASAEFSIDVEISREEIVLGISGYGATESEARENLKNALAKSIAAIQSIA